MGKSMLMAILVFACIFESCNFSSLEDCKEAGRTKTKQLFVELKKINSRDQLIDAEKSLTLCYKELLEVLIAAKEYLKAHSGEEQPLLTAEDRELGENIRFEMIRICRLEGGSELLDGCLRKALEEMKKEHPEQEKLAGLLYGFTS